MLLLTSCVNIIHAPPGFEYQLILTRIGQKVRYSFSMILANMMLFRFYLVTRLIPNLSKWTDMHAEECCEREGILADSLFAIKSLLKERPYLMLLLNFTISILLFGFSVRSFERAFYEDESFTTISHDDPLYQDYNYVWNSFWLIVVTMTTGNSQFKLHISSWFRRPVSFNPYWKIHHRGLVLLGHVPSVSICIHSPGLF